MNRRNVLVRVPGPTSRSDPFGLFWTQPEEASPGIVSVPARLVRMDGDSAEVERFGETHVVPESDGTSLGWLMPCGAKPETLKALRSAMRDAVGPKTEAIRPMLRELLMSGDADAAVMGAVRQIRKGRLADEDQAMLLLAAAVVVASG